MSPEVGECSGQARIWFDSNYPVCLNCGLIMELMVIYSDKNLQSLWFSQLPRF